MIYLNKPAEAEAINSLTPDAEFGMSGGVIFWDSPDITQPTKAEIDAEVTRLVAIYESQDYARKRRREYPSNSDQWDMIYKDNKNGTTTHAAAVEAVKTKWPKDNSGPVE